MKRKRITLLQTTFLTISLASFNLFGQLSTDRFDFPKSYDPKSPTSWEFEKFGDIPINNYNGSLNYQIPLFELSTEHLRFPISLTYSTKGVQLSSVSSWVGVDWNLVAEGSIRRQVFGESDLASHLNGGTTGFYGWLNQNNKRCQSLGSTSTNGAAVTFTDGSSPSNAWTYVNDLFLHHVIDQQADLFSFTCGQYSGEFFYKKDGTIVLISEQTVKITHPNDDNGEWTITTPDGVLYTFGNTTGTSNFVEWDVEQSVDVREAPYVRSNVVAWKLREIHHPVGESITFEYLSPIKCGQPQQVLTSRTQYTDVFTLQPTESILEDQSFNSAYLSTVRILDQNQDRLITFYSTERDQNSGGNNNYGYRKLDSVAYKITDLITNAENEEKVKFAYQINGNRLWLSSFSRSYIERKGMIVNRKNYPGNSFTYYNNSLIPSINDQGFDYFGHYNGVSANNNTHGFPSDGVYYYSGLSSFPFSNSSAVSANRYPSSTHLLYGYLSKIEYPTGGHTEFEYEPHQLDVNSFNGISQGAGIRIKKISHYAEGVLAKELNYSYYNGRLMSKPRFYFSGWSSLKGANVYFGPTYISHNFRNRPFVPAMALALGSLVGYDSVDVMMGGGEIGYERYIFKNQELASPNLVPNKAAGCFNSIPEMVSIPQSDYNSQGNGRLLTKKVFNNAGGKVEEVNNTYLQVSVGTREGTIFQCPAGTMYNDVTKSVDEFTSDYTPNEPIWTVASWHTYSLPYSVWLLTQSESTDFLTNGEFETIKNISYVNTTGPKFDFKAREESVLNSVGTVEAMQYHYASDYENTTDSEAQFVKNLSLAGFTALPILIVQKSGSLKLKSQIRLYDESNGNLTGVYGYEGPEVFFAANYNDLFSTSDKKMITYGYDSNDYLQYIQPENGKKQAFIWSELFPYPRAIVSNCNPGNFMFEDFETTVSATTDLSYSGRMSMGVNANNTLELNQSYQPDYTIKKIDVSLTALSISYSPSVELKFYKKESNGSFTYKGSESININTGSEWDITSASVDLAAKRTQFGIGQTDQIKVLVRLVNAGVDMLYVDEVRIIPSESSIVSFSFHPYYGLVSQVDERGFVSRFEYDVQGRLKWMRDFENNILAKYIYHYK